MKVSRWPLPAESELWPADINRHRENSICWMDLLAPGRCSLLLPCTPLCSNTSASGPVSCVQDARLSQVSFLIIAACGNYSVLYFLVQMIAYAPEDTINENDFLKYTNISEFRYSKVS